MKKLSSILLALCLGAGISFFYNTSSYGSGGNVQFSAIKGQLCFYEPSSGKVFVYGIGSGKLQFAWKVTSLGSDLQKAGGDASVWEKNRGE